MKVVLSIVVGVLLAGLAQGEPSSSAPLSAQEDATATSRIEIAPLPSVARPESALTIPWVVAGDLSWQTKELFLLKDKAGKPLAKGYAAVTDTDILVKVVMHDEQHINHRTGATIWFDDSIIVAADATGEAMRRSAKEGYYPGRAGAAVCFALTDSGPEAFALVHGRPSRAMAMPQLIATDTIVRDERMKTTTYSVALPWKEVGAPAGASPTIGLTVTVRDQNGSKAESYEWGHATSEAFRPAIFNRIYLGNPPGPVNCIAVWKDQLADKKGFGELRLATTDRRALKIEASLQGQTKAFQTPPAGADESPMRRFTVRGYPTLPPERPMVLSARMTADDKTLTVGDATLYRTTDVIGMVERRLDELIAGTGKNKLFARHLRSLKAVVAAQWTGDMLSFGPDSSEARQTATYCKFLLDGLSGSAGQWQTYLDRRLPLCLAFTSHIDGSVQFCKVLLPPKWDAAKRYPMIVQLHGVGNSNTIHFAARALIDEPPPPKGAYVPEAYVVMPWGRGNRGYRGVAEKDVFEVMAEAAAEFKIDPDRTYLWGHSMGGAGAWSIALRSPDRFAAVGISAGGNWNVPWTGLGANVDGLPFRIWHGLADRVVDPSYAGKMERELKKYHQDVTVVRTPKAQHNDGWTLAPVMEKWLMQYTRKRPDHFEYMADTPEHLGRNGVNMSWEPTMSVAPHFVCDIKGNEVRLAVTGTPEVAVNLGPDQPAPDRHGVIRGLGLTGTVTVIINGHQVFHGQVPGGPTTLAVPSSPSPAKK